MCLVSIVVNFKMDKFYPRCRQLYGIGNNVLDKQANCFSGVDARLPSLSRSLKNHTDVRKLLHR